VGNRAPGARIPRAARGPGGRALAAARRSRRADSAARGPALYGQVQARQGQGRTAEVQTRMTPPSALDGADASPWT